MSTFSIFCSVLISLLGAELYADGGLLNLPLSDSGLRYENIEALKPVWPAAHGEGSICLWGDDKHSALSITIDDNNAPDIPFWQEMSEEFEWKFTWFVIVHPMMWDIYENKTGNNTSYFGTAETYKALYEQGHEIGLHGSCKATNSLDEEGYREHVVKSTAHLESIVGNKILTYAYPCGATGPEGVYEKVIAETMIGARGTAGGPTPIQNGDILNTKSMGAANMANAQSIKRFQMLEDPTRPFKYNYYRGWPVFLYHGLGTQAKKDAVRETLKEIKSREDQFWIQPFGVVAAYIQERASAQLSISSVEPGRIIFEITDRMTDEFFTVPLTIKFKVEGWKNAAAKQGEVLLNTRVIQHDGQSFVLVDAVPDAGPVILIQR